MSSAGVGKLCFLKSKVTATVYQNVLEDFIIPSAEDPHIAKPMQTGLAQMPFSIRHSGIPPAHITPASGMWTGCEPGLAMTAPFT